jgi:hypothetical protein
MSIKDTHTPIAPFQRAATPTTDERLDTTVTAAPATPFKTLVDLMVGEGISALPVVGGGGHLLGVVSEADVLCKDEHLDDQHRQVHAQLAQAVDPADVVIQGELMGPSLAQVIHLATGFHRQRTAPGP